MIQRAGIEEIYDPAIGYVVRAKRAQQKNIERPRQVVEHRKRGLTTTNCFEGIVMANSHISVPTSVYRYYDENDLLLYVGITSRGPQRQREHNSDKEWWKFVARQEVEHYPSRAHAGDREKALIREYRPPFNVVHNPDHERTREAYIALATKHGLESRNVYPVLVRNLGKSRLSMGIERLGNVIILRSHPEDCRKVQSIDAESIDALTLSMHGAKGARLKLDTVKVVDGALTVMVHCRKHAEKVHQANVLLRMPNGKHQKKMTIKRIDLTAAESDVTGVLNPPPVEAA